MNVAQRNHNAALLKAAGYEDAPPLLATAGDGGIPHGRELNLAWLSGTVMTGFTSVMLMAAALYVSFQGQDTFTVTITSLASALAPPTASLPSEKTDRIKPVTRTRSDREVVEASIRENSGGRVMIRKQPFVRVEATLATAGTALSQNIPAYDPVALLNASRPLSKDDAIKVSTDIYGANIEGEVAVKTEPLKLAAAFVPTISDADAAAYVKETVLVAYPGSGDAAYLAYAPGDESVRDLGQAGSDVISGVAENVTVMPMSEDTGGNGLGRTERILTIKQPQTLEEALTKNGFTPVKVKAIIDTLHNVYPQPNLPAGAHLRILLGPSRNSDTVIPYRLSIYIKEKHAATVALTDQGRYVLALAPPPVAFPEKDTEQVNVSNLPTLYRSIWETGRKNDLPDAMIERILAMYAYDLDLTKRVKPGDSIEMLESAPDDKGHQELLYVNLKIGGVSRQFFRFRTDDGVVDYYDADGQTGKRFLTRRPLEGGGRISSRFGYRVHPVFRTKRLHSGVDLAAAYGTPIYAAADGVITRSGWVSGYGRMVQIQHANGYSTRYGHMSKFAQRNAPGVAVRQGQIIGYVGSSGISTGAHLHFEVRINGTPVDPLSVKLPRDKSLASTYDRPFKRTIAQIKDLMGRDPAPITVAQLEKQGQGG